MKFALPALVAFCLTLVSIPSIRAEDDSVLAGVVILSRHGVRAPAESPEKLSRYSDLAWPEWSVAPGELTPRGYAQMKDLGRFYGEYLKREGLFTGDAARDASRAYFRGNVFPRTIASARALAEGMFPGRKISPDHRRGKGDGLDPLFNPDQFAHFPADPQSAANSLKALNPVAHADALRAELRIIAGILSKDGRSPNACPGFKPDAPQHSAPAIDLPVIGAPIEPAYRAADNFFLQYTEGMPAEKVAWGRAKPGDFLAFSRVQVAYHDLLCSGKHAAGRCGSTMVSRIGATLDRMRTGENSPQDLGKPGDRLVVLAGHDSTLAFVDALLGFRRESPDGLAENFTPPGAAILFELRRERATGRAFVRVWYASQKLRDIREATPADDKTLVRRALVVRGCEASGPHRDMPWEKFSQALGDAVIPKYIVREDRAPSVPPAQPAPEPVSVR